MRTTLVLDDDLVHAAKQRALDEHATFSAIVNRALREYVQPRRRAEAEVPYRCQTFGDPSNPLHLEPADFHKMIEDDEMEKLRKLGLG